MIKTIKIDGKDIQFKASATFALKYKSYFDKDILTIILPAMSEVLRGLDGTGIIEESKDKTEITAEFLATILENLYSVEMVDILQIIWVCAKSADETIPDVETWIDSFDEFPIFEIAVEVFKLILPTFFSKKKLGSIEKMINPNLKKSTK